MDWIINNWSMIVVVIAFIVVFYIQYRKFCKLPSEQQLAKVKAFLLVVVVEAERIYKSKTGRIKLSYAYEKFVQAFPSLVPIIPFELFASMVDEVLEQMRNMLEDNENVRNYVELEKEEQE